MVCEVTEEYIHDTGKSGEGAALSDLLNEGRLYMSQ